METLFIIFGAVWFVMALMLVCALAAAGRRPCPDRDSRAFLSNVASARRRELPPFLPGTANAIPAT